MRSIRSVKNRHGVSINGGVAISRTRVLVRSESHVQDLGFEVAISSMFNLIQCSFIDFVQVRLIIGENILPTRSNSH